MYDQNIDNDFEMDAEGVLFFSCYDGKRFLECYIDWDEGEKKWVLWANDKEVVKF